MGIKAFDIAANSLPVQTERGIVVPAAQCLVPNAQEIDGPVVFVQGNLSTRTQFSRCGCHTRNEQARTHRNARLSPGDEAQYSRKLVREFLRSMKAPRGLGVCPLLEQAIEFGMVTEGLVTLGCWHPENGISEIHPTDHVGQRAADGIEIGLG